MQLRFVRKLGAKTSRDSECMGIVNPPPAPPRRGAALYAPAAHSPPRGAGVGWLMGSDNLQVIRRRRSQHDGAP